MRRRKIWLNIIAVAIVIICSAIIGTMMNAEDNSNELMIAVVSLGVALIALYISLRTFYSIDEVNAISRMDGNVMENPRYSPNILRAVFRFPQITFTDTSDALMSYMDGLFQDKNKQSGAHIADNVQEVANLLVLVPYFIKANNQELSSVNLDRVSVLLDTIKCQVDNFKEISDGSCKLLEETIKLIESIFAYQRVGNQKADPSKLLEIRGSIFVNPVTIILYNDYLGLYFLKRAHNLLCNHQTNLSWKQMADNANRCSSDDRAMALVYCDKAIDAFKHAKDNVGDDMIWTGYICFNIARAEYMKQLLNESFGDTLTNDWETSINESIRSWITINKMIAEHFCSKMSADEKTWLQQAFISEERFVRLTKVILQIIKQQPITDFNGNPWVDKYEEFTETPFFVNLPKVDPQKLSDGLVEEIRKLIHNN